MRWSLRAGMLATLLFPCAALFPCAVRAGDMAEIDRSISGGIEYLRKAQSADGSWVFSTADNTPGATSLAGLTLLMCGVDKEDQAVTAAAKFARARAVSLGYTYSIALTILFLDKLGDPADVPLLESLAARLVAGQSTTDGAWSYYCPVPVTSEQRRLAELVSQGPAALSKGDSKGEGSPKDKARLESREFQKRIALLTTTNAAAGGRFSRPDNSNTQFATIALWVSRRHGFPVDGALRMVERHFRGTQCTDGGWPYFDNSAKAAPVSTPTMTCAGLLGMAVGYGVFNDKAKEKGVAARDPIRDPLVQAALSVLSLRIGVPSDKLFGPEVAGEVPAPRLGGGARGAFRRGFGGGPRTRTAAGRLYYYLWSLERVSVALNLDTIGKKDWYAWGSEFILSNQEADGSWQGDYGAGGVDTCFALLFLKRANLASDLSALMSRAHNPGRMVLKAGDPGSTEAAAAKDDQRVKPAPTDRVADGGPAPAAKDEHPAKPAPTDRAADGSSKPAPVADDHPVKPATPDRVADGPKPAATKDDHPAKPAGADSTATKDTPKVIAEKVSPSQPKVASAGDTSPAKLAEALLALPSREQDTEIDRLRNQKGGENTEALALAVPRLSPDQRRLAREALAEREGRMKADTVGRDLSDENPEIRRAAALACALKETKQFVPQLIGLLNDPELTVARAAHAALKDITGQDFGPAGNADASDRKRATTEWQEWWKKQPH
jgi:Prenyltransferase and squalene oxidase repeat